MEWIHSFVFVVGVAAVQGFKGFRVVHVGSFGFN